MQTFIEPLYKAPDRIRFGWNPEPISDLRNYKVYVGQVSGSLSVLEAYVDPQRSNDPVYNRKVAYNAEIADVRTVLGLSSTQDFSNTILYFAITYQDSTGAESALSESRVVEVPPVGIMGKTRKEDPTANRHIFGFSDEEQRWVKVAASGSGALVTSTNDYWAANTVSEYTYDGGGNVLTEKIYLSDRTSSGSPAKLITYEYSGGNLSKKTITDSTV